MRSILQLQVNDRPGVLDRVVSLIRRRGWNISSLTAGDIGEGVTQITILLQGRDLDVPQLGEYLSEMDAVRHWHELSEAGSLLRELLVYCLPMDAAPATDEAATRALETRDGLRYYEYTDTPSRLDLIAQALHAQKIPFVRSGPLSLIPEKEDA